MGLPFISAILLISSKTGNLMVRLPTPTAVVSYTLKMRGEGMEVRASG